MSNPTRPNIYTAPLGSAPRPLTAAEQKRRARLALWTKPIALLPVPTVQVRS